MKAIKLKPIFFPNDDILVKPPDFLMDSEDFSIDKQKNHTIASTDQLITILRGRQLKKQNNQKTQITEEEEEETVKRLSEWRKNVESPLSPFKRKFSFKRTITMQVMADGKSNNRSSTVVQNLIPTRKNPMESLATAVQGIVAVERFKKKILDAEILNISEKNKKYEASVKIKISRITQEIKEVKKYLQENSEKLEKIKKDFSEIMRKHEEELNALNLKEAQELLFVDKGKKKLLKPGDESQYFIKKDKLRQLKQELHKKYQEDKENYTNQIERTKRSLDISETHRLQSKKELQIYRDEIVMLYCRILKDGKDIRSDGLRWVIKALWNMKEYIPISAFPKFCDDESSHFLLLMSEKDLENENLSKRLEALRKEIKNKRTSMSITTSRDLYRTVRSRLRNISQSSVGQLLDGSTPVDELNHTYSDTNARGSPTNYSEITEIREKLAANIEFVKEITTQEIKRVTEAYQINPGEATEVGLFHVIKCLVGEKVREFNKYTRSSGKNSKKIRGSILY